MRRLLRYLPKPSQPWVTRAVVRELTSAGVPAESISSDPEKLELRVGEQRLYLGNLLAECERLWPWERRKRIRVFVQGLVEKPSRPATLSEARPRLLPGIRDSFMIDKLALDRPKGWRPVPGQCLGSRLFLAPYVDSETTTSNVTVEDLKRWGASLEEVLEVALQNLAAKPARSMTEIAPGLFHSNYQDCYDPARMLLRETFPPLDIKGDPVVFAPNWNHLLVAGAEDVAALVGGMVVSAQIMVDEPRPMSALPLVRRDGSWVDLELPKGHPAEPTLRKTRVTELAEIYAEQKKLIEKRHAEDGTDIFVATYMGLKSESDDYTSCATWTKGVLTLLPRAEEVVFIDPDLPTDRKAAGRFDWDIVWFHCSTMLERQPEHSLVRYYVDSFPSPDQLEAMRQAQEQRSKAGSTA